MLNARLLGAALIAAAVPAYTLHLAIGSKMCQFIACMLILFGIAACWRIRSNPESLRGKRIFITGCDTSIGRALAERLFACGCVVYAGCSSLTSPGTRLLRKAVSEADNESSKAELHCLQLDVTSDEEVEKAADFVRHHLGIENELWAIVNCAGVQCAIGDLEFATIEQVKRCMEVNYFGFIRVSQSLLSELRTSRGRLVAVCSSLGRSSRPLSGCYSATQFAVEAAMDAWRLELGRFGVAATLVEADQLADAVGILNEDDGPSELEQQLKEQWLVASEEMHDAYGQAYFDALVQRLKQQQQQSNDSLQSIVDATIESLATDAPLDRYFVSADTSNSSDALIDLAKWVALARDWMPASLHDALIGWRSLAALPLPQQAADWLISQRQPFFH